MKQLVIFIFVCIATMSCHTKNKEIQERVQQSDDTAVTPADTGYLIGMDIPEYRYTDLSRQFIANHDRSMGYHQNLLDSFEESGQGKESGRPEYFGGSYINEDGNFVILIKGNIADYRQEFEERVKGKDFILKQTDVSYAELHRIKDKIGIYMSTDRQNNEVARNIISIVLDEKNSRIEVGLEDLSPEAIQQFKENVIDSPYIQFVAGEYIELV